MGIRMVNSVSRDTVRATREVVVVVFVAVYEVAVLLEQVGDFEELIILLCCGFHTVWLWSLYRWRVTTLAREHRDLESLF